MEVENEIDQRFCWFCQDRTPEGRMVVVKRGTQEVISEEPTVGVRFGTCARCGLSNTDRFVGVNSKGEHATLQFEHDKFDTEMVQPLTETIAAAKCSTCGVPIYLDNGGCPIAPRDFALRMMRMYPDIDSDCLIWSCNDCANTESTDDSEG